jgi:outer membrane receptor for ferrienterochelin and colicins
MFVGIRGLSSRAIGRSFRRIALSSRAIVLSSRAKPAVLSTAKGAICTCSFLAALGMAFAASPVAAQTGTLRGRVIDGAGAPVANVIVQAQSSAQPTGSATSAADGAYSLALPAGTYTVVTRRIGFTSQRIEGVEVRAGSVRELDITLSAVATVLNQVVISATPVAGGGEKVLDAPAHVGVVTSLEVQERPSLTVADHLKAQPGVDVSHGGLVQANIVSRGFNNAFSGSMLVLQDNRFSSVPSLRVNVPFLSPSVNEDIERIETLLGPAAALYGPNSANGVLHVITKSPFTSQGGTVTIDAGERSVIRGAARYAGVMGEKLGFKVSGELMRGDDWEYKDPAEPATIQRPTGAITGAGVGVRTTVPNVCDFAIEKAAGEARVDVRLKPGVEWINTLGMTHAGNYIEITGANGAAQARNWNYMAAQSRLKWNKTFAQIFYNTSNSGNKDSLDASGTFLLRTGTPIVDNSRVLTAQLQHAIDIGTRQSFVIGGDWIGTNPRTGGTINGRNEGIDDVREVGGYLHSVTRFNEKWEFVGALRLDDHSEQEDMFFSPRAALVFKPTANQNVRFTYNRAFSTPANFSFFLDLPQGRIPIGANFYTIRALGVPETGFYYPKNSSTGVGGLYMRSIFPVLAPNPTAPPAFAPQTRIDAHAALLYRTLVAGNQTAFVNALIAAGVSPSNAGTVFGNLLGVTDPTPAQIGTTLRLFNPAGVGTPAGPFATIMQPADLMDVGRLKSTINSVFEVGYKGIMAERLRLAINGWFEQKENFTTPAVSVTPNAFMNSAQLGAFIGARLAAEAAAGRVPAAAVPTLTTAFTTTLAQVPVGTIMLEQPGVAPDNGLTNRSDLIFTYRNVDQLIELYGADMGLDFLATDLVTIAGTYGWISKTEFPNIPSGTGPLRINAPAHKASLAARYRNEQSGWSGELRGRYTDAFSVNSGVYIGRVPVNALLDANVTYRLPTLGKGASVSLAATNLLDERVPTFIGVPDVGRLIMTRLQYNF